jgi:hypothetical protein
VGVHGLAPEEIEGQVGKAGGEGQHRVVAEEGYKGRGGHEGQQSQGEVAGMKQSFVGLVGGEEGVKVEQQGKEG